MPVIPTAVLESSPDDSLQELNEAYHDGQWAVVNLRSLQSIPFSDFSHSPYGQESNYLDTHSAISAGTSLRPAAPVRPALLLSPISPTIRGAYDGAIEGTIAAPEGRPTPPDAPIGAMPSPPPATAAPAAPSTRKGTTTVASKARGAAAEAAPAPPLPSRHPSERVLRALVRRELRKPTATAVSEKEKERLQEVLPTQEQQPQQSAVVTSKAAPCGRVPPPPLATATATTALHGTRASQLPSPVVTQSMRELTNARRLHPHSLAAGSGAAPRSGEAGDSGRGRRKDLAAEDDEGGSVLLPSRPPTASTSLLSRTADAGSARVGGRQRPLPWRTTGRCPATKASECSNSISSFDAGLAVFSQLPSQRGGSTSPPLGEDGGGGDSTSVGTSGTAAATAAAPVLPQASPPPVAPPASTAVVASASPSRSSAPAPSRSNGKAPYPERRTSRRGSESLPSASVVTVAPADSCTATSFKKSTTAPEAAGVAPKKRKPLCPPLPPAPLDADTDTRVPTASERAATASEERLVAFVREVSDAEVLHVIADYLREHKAGRQYQQAARICNELLERKERLLAEVVGNTGGGSRGGRRSPGAGSRPLHAVLPDEDDIGVSDTETDEEDDLADEFGDLNFHDTPYPDVPSEFQFSEPSVTGTVSAVFKEGMLYKIKDSRGDYYFYNDTLNKVMMVRAQCFLRGNERINERAITTPVEGTSAVEVTIAVLPEETNFFIGNCKRLPRIVAKAVGTPADFTSPSVTRYMTRMNAEINAVRAALGQWSKATDQHAYLKCCLRNRLPFTDLDFRPSALSLYRPHIDAVKIPALTWRRPAEYLAFTEVAETRLFRGEISCHLVKQGELSDHTVVAAIAALAQFPHHVMWMFRHPSNGETGKRERAIGCYRVTLLSQGWWTGFVVDDYVPASVKGPLFAQCPADPRRLWVPLLEKAYAKLQGSYAAICLADVLRVLADFTGFPGRNVDAAWLQAQRKPTEAPAVNLFRYLQRCTSHGYVVLLYTPAAGDVQAAETIDLSRRRSIRIAPVDGVVPQFLPGHVYLLTDAAHYKELDLRMVRLKNPWTWETSSNSNTVGAAALKRWKYTGWYERPDQSFTSTMTATGSQAGGCLSRRGSCSRTRRGGGAVAAAAAEARAAEEARKGTMWLEWGEALAAFAGASVCYTAWHSHHYRVRSSFGTGCPDFVVELSPVTRKVELLLTIAVEGVWDALDAQRSLVTSAEGRRRKASPNTQGVAAGGTDTDADAAGLCGVTLTVTKRARGAGPTPMEEVCAGACEDIECVAAKTTYVRARTVSMKMTLEPNSAPYHIIPRVDPADAQALRRCGEAQLQCVLGILSSIPAGKGELGIHFKRVPRSCAIFEADARKFTFGKDGCSPYTATYQYCDERGFTTASGTSLVPEE